MDIEGGRVTIGGMAKGSGMIEPNLATMLGFLTTDAAVEPTLLRRALVDACDDTFNAITVDGECSTNDSVFLLANGASGVVIGRAGYPAFVRALREVCLDLALGIVRGGEGAKKLVTVSVTGAATGEDARKTARAIANSPLVKTAIHGGDPNWGRLVAVAGAVGGPLRALPARASSSATWCCSRTAGRSTNARRSRPSTCRATTSRSWSTWAPAAPTRRACSRATSAPTT